MDVIRARGTNKRSEELPSWTLNIRYFGLYESAIPLIDPGGWVKLFNASLRELYGTSEDSDRINQHIRQLHATGLCIGTIRGLSPI